MPVSLGRAALLADVGKNTINRAIKAGKLTAIRERGRYFIDEAELSRVFKLTPEAPRMDPTGFKAEVEALRTLLAEVRASRDDLRRERDDWKVQADAWRAQAERLTMIAESKAQR